MGGAAPGRAPRRAGRASCAPTTAATCAMTEGLAPSPLMWPTNAAGQREADQPYDEHELTINREQMMLGSYDPHARLVDMDTDGLAAEVLYPGPLGGLGGGGGVASIPDDELRAASLRAYNDWLAGFCAVAPRRLIGLALVRLEEPKFAAAEVERVAGLGLRGAVINGVPDTMGGPPIFSPDYEPVWSVAEEAGLPLSLHIGHSRSLAALANAAPRCSASSPTNPLSPTGSQTGLTEMFFTMMCLDMAEPLALLIHSGVLERHPQAGVRDRRERDRLAPVRRGAHGLHVRAAPAVAEVRHP